MEKGKIAGLAPKLVDAEKGKTIAWCACGKSSNQPFCNGAHKDSGYAPIVFSEEEDKKIALCMCKQTSNPPYCDGTHAQLRD
jgi:CDGSH-type Zn-finger protein